MRSPLKMRLRILISSMGIWYRWYQLRESAGKYILICVVPWRCVLVFDIIYEYQDAHSPEYDIRIPRRILVPNWYPMMISESWYMIYFPLRWYQNTKTHLGTQMVPNDDIRIPRRILVPNWYQMMISESWYMIYFPLTVDDIRIPRRIFKGLSILVPENTCMIMISQVEGPWFVSEILNISDSSHLKRDSPLKIPLWVITKVNRSRRESCSVSFSNLRVLD